jgi:hypothetical protein
MAVPAVVNTTVFSRCGRGDERSAGFRVVLDLLRRTDQTLFRRIARKMLNQLSFNGVERAQALLRQLASREAPPADENQPFRLRVAEDPDALTAEAFGIAGEHLSEAEILSLLQVWIKEDRINFLVVALEARITWWTS